VKHAATLHPCNALGHKQTCLHPIILQVIIYSVNVCLLIGGQVQFATNFLLSVPKLQKVSLVICKLRSM